MVAVRRWWEGWFEWLARIGGTPDWLAGGSARSGLLWFQIWILKNVSEERLEIGGLSRCHAGGIEWGSSL